MKKRKRSTIRKAQEVILRTADNLQKSGIDCSRRFMFVGGTKPKAVHKARDERQPKKEEQ